MRAIGSRSAAKKRRVGDGGAEPVDSVIVLRDSGGEAASGAMERKMLSMLMTRTEDHRRPLTRQAEAVDRRGRTARLASWTAAALWTEHLALHLWARGLAAAARFDVKLTFQIDVYRACVQDGAIIDKLHLSPLFDYNVGSFSNGQSAHPGFGRGIILETKKGMP